MTPGAGGRLTPYDIGMTPYYALQYDTRLSYCLYVPESYEKRGTRTYPLIVLVHGTERGAGYYRNLYRDFAEAQGAILLMPLFPCNLFFIGDTENYKLLRYEDTRFDLALLAMVDEVAARYRLTSDNFLMHGFSGGGHFTHRFLYAHPDRLLGASIGAPGVVTLCDPALDFPLGLKGMAAFLGDDIRPDDIHRVPVQCVVGAEDTQTWEITVPEDRDSMFWVPGINDTGVTRIERLQSLARSLGDAGCDIRFDMVPGLDHDETGVVPKVQDFFRDLMARNGV